MSSESQATKVSFASDDHSAITTSQTGYLKSKWGPSPLFLHSINDCPYNSLNLRYYVNLPSISGSTMVGTSGSTFTLSNGTATSWTCSSNLQITNSSSTSVTVRSIYDGKGWIRALANDVIIAVYDVWSGKPVINSISWSPQHITTSGYTNFTANYDAACNPTSFQWILNPVNGNTVYAGGHTCDVAFYNTGSYQIVVRATNANGIGEYCTAGFNVSSSSSYSFVVYPNPAENQVTVDLTAPDETVSYVERQAESISKKAEIQLWSETGMIKSVKTTDSKIVLSVSNFPSGIYYVRVIRDGTTSTQTLIVK